MNDASLPRHPSDPDALARRLIHSAHLSDGLPEILVGLSFLFFSAMNWLSLPASKGSVAARVFILIIIALIIFAGFSSTRLIASLRTRYLIARSGYVRRKAQKPSAIQIATTAILVVAANTLVALGFWSVLSQHWILICCGTLFGALWMLLGRLPRFVIGGLLIAGSALLLGFLALPPEIDWGAFCTFAGVLMLASGGWALVRLMHTASDQPE